ncbi:predicted protein [Nematostella vectensis]|uniref:Dynamin-type G domain-containing protein n=1 Tax=Nematostella vectensis TaxID=45351 RepID=A7S1L1_NEMVE|nr:predicted protein [Nematostella vectensis]|eukprot:XP_001634442.1 predicted protein [Nematostella vectensis]
MRNSGSIPKRSFSVKESDKNGVGEHSSPLHNFVKAKKKINETVSEIGKYLDEANRFICGCEIAEDYKSNIKGFACDVAGFLGQVASITEVIARDQMKVAFFGRTSNGKSTVVNAMLQDRILPMGIGHTTNCFLSVNGSDSADPYILIPESDERRNVKTLGQIAHALFEEKLDHSSLVQVYWPKSRCKMLSEDVVLVDSPGIDVSPDLDLWIDKHCLDADVFVLVCNAESTLMVTEKNFFHKVNQKLSKPNIFILNNRWDASAGEPDVEMMELVKKQHLQRNVDFLSKELKCVDKKQAEDRVFFVSAKETLMSRMQKHQGMPEEGGAIHVDGFHGRKLEFENFEHKFEECISKSAIQTKFESHAGTGIGIVNAVQNILEQIAGCAYEHRKRLISAKRERENRLEFVKEQLDYCTNECKEKIKHLSTRIEQQVADAMTEEIGRLGVLVNEFEHPFHTHPGFLRTYKKELHEYIEKGLGRNLMARCSSSQTQLIQETQQDMIDRLQKLLPCDEPQSVLPLTPRQDFEVCYQLEIHNLCSDFKEDIEFHFSLGWEALVKRFLAPRNARLAILVPSTDHHRELEPRPAGPVMPRCSYSDEEMTLAVIHGVASLTSRTATVVVLAGGLLWRVMGWRIIICCTGLYGGLYVIERLRWTNSAKEKTFKRQFVDFASEKLQLVVSFTSSNCGLQVQQELSSTFSRLQSLVHRSKENLEDEILELEAEITRLESIESRARVLKNKACWFESELVDFLKTFGLNKSKI